jgi:hypothetical protein
MTTTTTRRTAAPVQATQTTTGACDADVLGIGRGSVTTFVTAIARLLAIGGAKLCAQGTRSAPAGKKIFTTFFMYF